MPHSLLWGASLLAGASFRQIGPPTAVAAAVVQSLPVPSCGDGQPLDATTIIEPSPQVSYAEKRAVVLFEDTRADDTDRHVTLLAQDQVSSTFGLAYDPYRNQLYAASYYKTPWAVGPAGTGGIYRLDLDTGDLVTWAQLAAGPVALPRGESNPGPYIGKRGLGDIELSDDAGELFAVNLYDRRIYRPTVPDGRVVDSFAHGAVHEPWAENARPFGLAFHEGWLYHGVVNSQANDPPGGELVADVYRSRADGTEMSLVVSIDLDYPREPPWQAWSDDVRRDGIRHGEPAQALLTDIAVRQNGDLLVGLRDRTAEMERVSMHPLNHMGDLIPVRNEGGRMRAVTEPEFYEDETIVDEATLGTLAVLPAQDVVVVSVASADGKKEHPSGILWLDNGTGEIVGRETIVDRLDSQHWLRPLGDVEVVCRRDSPPRTRTPAPTATATVPTATATPSRSPTPTQGASATVTREPRLPAGVQLQDPVLLPLMPR